MSMYGAVPSELREFGMRFVAQQENVVAIQQAVVAALGGTTWVGPAREQFGEDWNTKFNPALDGLRAAFEQHGRAACERANALEQVMGITASA